MLIQASTWQRNLTFFEKSKMYRGSFFKVDKFFQDWINNELGTKCELYLLFDVLERWPDDGSRRITPFWGTDCEAVFQTLIDGELISLGLREYHVEEIVWLNPTNIHEDQYVNVVVPVKIHKNHWSGYDYQKHPISDARLRKAHYCERIAERLCISPSDSSKANGFARIASEMQVYAEEVLVEFNFFSVKEAQAWFAEMCYLSLEEFVKLLEEHGRGTKTWRGPWKNFSNGSCVNSLSTKPSVAAAA
jgi:hypothetical protein